MTKSEIRSKISKYTNKIQGLEQLVDKKKGDLKKLYKAEDIHKAKAQALTSKMEREKSNLNNFNRIEGINMVPAYGDDMRSLLGGSFEQGFLENIKGIENKITKKIDDTEEEIIKLRREISSYQDRIRSLRRELSRLD